MINISKKIHVGYSSKSSYDLPVAEIIPDSSHSGQKLLSRLIKTKTEVHEYENIPLPGFTLYTNYKRSYGADTSWLVIDPRGFLFNISAENLNNILSVTGITEGLIQEKCVWVRDNSSKNVFLLPVTAEEYSKAVENTEILDQKVKLKDVEIGDYVLLQNELVGKYCGTLTLYGPPAVERTKSEDEYLKIKTYNKRQIIEIQPGKFFASTNAKILKVIQKAEKPMTKIESCKYINNLIEEDPNVYFSSSTDVLTGKYYFSDTMIIFSSPSEENTSMSLREIDKNKAESILKTLYNYRHDTKLLFEDSGGRRYKLDAYFNLQSSSGFRTQEIIWPDANAVQQSIQIKKDKSLNSFMRFNRSEPSKTIDDFVKFYIIEKHVNDQTFI